MPTDPTASEVAQDRELLDRLGYGVLDVGTGSGVGFEDVRRYTYLVEPGLSPRATAAKLRQLLGRPLTEAEAQATWDEILEYKLGRQEESGEETSFEQAAREWDEKYGFGFRRRWYLTRPEPGERRYVPGGRERGPGPVGRAMSLTLPELRPLLDAGFSVANVLTAVARKPGSSVRYVLRRVPKGERHTYYVRLMAKLTGWRLSEEEAERAWAEILKHKLYLSERTGHDVSIERAVVDYFKRLRLSGLDRAALWETGQLFAPNANPGESDHGPSTRPRDLFPA